MSIRGWKKNKPQRIFNQAQIACCFLLSGFALPLSQLWEGCVWSVFLSYLPERWLSHSAVWEDSHWRSPCWERLSHAGQRRGPVSFCFSLHFYRALWQALVLFLCWSWTPYLFPFFFRMPLLFFSAVTWGGLGERCWRIIELLRERELRVALSPVCFLIGKQHFRELNWHRVSAKTCRVQEYSQFPGPGSAEVGFSEEGALGEGGEERGTCRSRCSWLQKESCSNQSSAVLQTIHSFGEGQTKHSLLVRRINVRGWS